MKMIFAVMEKGKTMSKEKQTIEEMAKDVAHSISWCDDVIPTVDCLGTAAALYGIGYRKQEWISVEDDTPKDGEKRVQVFLRDDDFTKPIGENKIDTDRYIDGKWVRWGKHVTHWMPLPEAPKMKGGEQE